MPRLSLIESIEENGPPRLFSAAEVQASPNLFRERGALFYTPTRNLPSAWVGSGDLDVTLPIASPTFFEYLEIRWYQTSRLWVDLLQRATGKIRWTPMSPVEVIIIRYDAVEIGYGEGIGGAKALLDSLKEQTFGRADGHPLYYFGAIVDDNPDELLSYKFQEQLVEDPSQAKCRVIVKPLQKESQQESGSQRPSTAEPSAAPDRGRPTGFARH
jgi:hypothetical protein